MGSDLRARGREPAGRDAAGGGRRLRLLPRQRERVPGLLLRRARPARGRRGRPARAHRAPAPAAALGGRARAPEAASPAAAAERHRRDHRRERQGPRRRAGRAPAPRLAGTAGVGLHARSRTATPRRRSAGRSADLAAVAEVQVAIIARGGGSQADLLALSDETLCRTVAHVRDPGDRLGGPPHRPYAARRRGRRELLDAHPRGRGGGGRSTVGGRARRPSPRPCACATTAAGRSSRGREP